MQKFLRFILFAMLIVTPPLIAQESSETPILPSETPLPSATYTELPTLTPLPSETPTELPTATLWPSETPTETATATLTETLWPTETAVMPELTQALGPEFTAELTAELTPELTAELSATATGTSTAAATSTQALNSGTAYTSIAYFDVMNLIDGAWEQNPNWQFVEREGQVWIATEANETITTWQGTGKNIALDLSFVLSAGSLSLSLRNSEAGFYRLDLDSAGNISLWRGTTLVTSNILAPLATNSHSLKFRAHEGQITAELDGNLVLAFADTNPLPKGHIGLSIQDANGFLLREIFITMDAAEQAARIAAVPRILQLETGANNGQMSLMGFGESNLDVLNAIVFVDETPTGYDGLFYIDYTTCQSSCDDERQLLVSSTTGDITNPYWSPDRTKLAFIYRGLDSDDEQYIYYVEDVSPNLELLTATQVTDMPVSTFGGWSNNGSQLAFSAFNGDSRTDIYVVGLPTEIGYATPENLTNSPTLSDSHPSWSPVEALLAYSGMVTSGTNIFIMDTGGIIKKEIHQGWNDRVPDWSPNGQEIAFNSIPSSSGDNSLRSDVWIYNRVTNTPRLLSTSTSKYHHITEPSWSPNGEYIVVNRHYTETPDYTDGLYIADSAGNDPTLDFLHTNGYEPDWGFPSNEQCAYAPFGADRLSEDTNYSAPIRFRSEPNDGGDVSIIGAFYGVKLGATNEPIDALGNVISLEFVDYLDVHSAGVISRSTDTVTYRTDNRRLTPLYKHTNSFGHLWYLIDYDGSLAWVWSSLIRTENCGFIPVLPEDKANLLNLDTYYNETLPTAQGLNGTVPDPSAWQPFGECIARLELDASRERCSYEVYVEIYAYLNNPAFGIGSFQLNDVLAIVLLNEWGNELDPSSFAELTQPQLYILEASIRNFAYGCAQERGFPIGEQAFTCDMRGISAFLAQVHSLYNEYTFGVNPIGDARVLLGLDSGDDYQVFLDKYMPTINDPDHADWATGGGPAQWGNWLSDHVTYTTASGIFNGTITPNSNVRTLNDWVYVDPNNQNPLMINGTVYAISIYNVGTNCPYSVAITTSAPNLGATQACN